MTHFAFKVFVVVVLSFVPTVAQTNYTPIGIPHNSSTIPIPLGFVDPLSQQVHLEIPIASVALRGGQTYNARLIYDTTIYTFSGNNSAFDAYGGGGWWMSVGTGESPSLGYTETWGTCPDPGYTYGQAATVSGFYGTDIHGTVHPIAWSGTLKYVYSCTNSSGQHDPTQYTSSFIAPTSDGSGYTYSVSLGSNNGYPQAQIWDVGGNESSYAVGVPFVDTNGNLGQGQFSQLPVTVTGSAYSCWGTTATGYVYIYASDGSKQTYTFSCKAYSVSNTTKSGTVDLLSSITLPDGTSYGFGYDTGSTGNHDGQMTSVKLPTGGQVSLSLPSAGSGGALLSSVTFGGGTWNLSSLETGSGLNTKMTGTVTGPLNDKTVYTSALAGPPWHISTVQFYSGSSTLLKTVSYGYSDTYGGGCLSSLATTLNDTGQSSSTQYQYVGIGSPAVVACSLVVQKQEYDFGASSPTRTTKMSYQGDTGTIKYNSQYHIYNRPASINVYAGTGSGSPVSTTNYTYDEYGANYCKNSVPMLTSITGAVGHDDTNHSSSFWARGNVTSTSKLVSGSTYVTTHSCYDTLGNATQVVDGNGNPTNFDYTDRWADGSCIASGSLTHAFPTTITDALGHRVETTRYTCTGLQSAVADENDIHASRAGTTYNYDWANRPLCIHHADGGQTCNTYSTNYSTQTSLLTSTSNIGTEMVVDGYGRTVQTLLTTDPEGTDFTDIIYDTLGREASVSNPYRTTHDPTYGITTRYYDALGRSTSIGKPDGSSVATSYSGNTTTETDEAGHKRKLQYDGLGRLAKVWEDPSNLNYETDYYYDALDDLTQVTQGSETRTFSYDGLARMLSAFNPESGNVAYIYDNYGNLLQKTDARGIHTNYYYDALNRLTERLYSDGTPTAGYSYDQTSVWGVSLSNTIGRLSQEGVGTAQRIFSYDPMGRLANQFECLPSSCGQFTYNASMLYDLAGDLTQLTYPSSRVISNTYSGAQRVTQVALTKANGQSLNYFYASGLKYSPNGALNVSTIGNNSSTALTETYGYNNRLQMASESIVSPVVGMMNHSYGFVAGQNNGNVPSIVDQLTSSRTQTFGYDSLNRLSTAVETAWGLGFVYDRYGNLLQQNVTLGSAPAFSAAANTKNQLVGYGYDVSGNMTSDGSHTYQYDAESRLKTLDGGSSATYSYDTENTRIVKQVGSDTAEYIIANGQTLSQHHISNWSDWSDLVYLNGRLLAKADSYEDRILITGSNPGPGYSLFAFSGAGGYAGYVMRSGDKLFLRQYQSTGSHGGMQIAFTDGTNTNWNATDSDGQEINNDGTQVSWHYRRIDLSTFAGKTINAIYLDQEVSTTASPWSIYFTDIALVSADGSVRPLYNRETGISLSHSGTSTGTASVNHASSESQIPDVTTTFYHGDHLGSSRDMSSVNGYPVWQATYLPFGYEYNPQITVNNFKFTGKEWDAESGLDYFGARHYTSIGRFMVPDSSGSDASEPTSPQSWNLYAYALNNPLRFIDPTGHTCISAGTVVPMPNGQEGWLIPGNCVDMGHGCTSQDFTAPGSGDASTTINCTPSGPSDIEKMADMIPGGRDMLAFNKWAGSALSFMRPCAPGVSCGVAYPAGGVGGGLAGDLMASRPVWAATPGGFVNWLKNLESASVKLSPAQLDAIADECQSLGIKAVQDPPHPGSNWNVDHWNIGSKGQVHLEVPSGYSNPKVPMRQ